MPNAHNIRTLNDVDVITATELRALYLFGVTLKDGDGNDMPDSTLTHYIKSAMRWLEAEIPGLIFNESVVITDEVHDYYFSDYTNFGAIQTRHFPVLSIEKYAVQFPLNTTLIEFSTDWLKVSNISGHINLIPTQGTLSSILIGQGGSFLPLVYSGQGHVPFLIHVNYTAGFAAGKIPEIIKDLVGQKAAIGVLHIMGDLIAGAGIANKSISLDGVSQSIGTTSSATNAGYGARIINYEKQIKEALEQLRNYYVGINMVVA